MPPGTSGTADALDSPCLLLATHTPLGRTKILQMCGSLQTARDGLKRVSNPSSKLGAPTASPLSGAPAPGASPFPFPFSSLSLFLPPCYPPGRPPALGKGQSVGPSVLMVGSLGCGRRRALALAGGTSCACFTSPPTSAGRMERLQSKDIVCLLVPFRSLIPFGALKAALNEDIAA